MTSAAEARADQVTLVTGGGSGIGAEVCRRLAGPGRTIIVHTGANRANAERVADDVEGRGGRAMVFVADFRRPETAASIVAAVEREVGGVDQIAHMAGHAVRGRFVELDPKAFDAALAVNTRAFLHLVTAAVPLLRCSPAGRIVTAGSFLAHAHHLSEDVVFAAGAASKAALAAMTRTLAIELAPEGINVNCVVPGLIDKDPGRDSPLDSAERMKLASRIPMRRFGHAREVADVVCFLLSPAASYVTGQCVLVDGGLCL